MPDQEDSHEKLPWTATGRVQVMLVYRPQTESQGQLVTVAVTGDATILRRVRDQVLAEAWAEVKLWKTIDPGIYTLRLAEATRLTQVLKRLVPFDTEDKIPNPLLGEEE